MNKEVLKKIIEGKFQNSATKELFFKQVDNYFEYNEKNCNIYKKGENVLLTTNSLIHGSRIEPEKISIIKENGLIASEFYLTENILKKKPYVVEFWNVEKKMTLKEFIDIRAGVTIEIIDKDGKIKNDILSSIENISQNLKKIKNYREYVIYQNQEQRFVPNDYYNSSTVAFIINNDTDKKNEILKNDIFSDEFNRTVLEEILPEWYIERYIDGKFDIHETGREKGIVFGIPAGLIEGILVCNDIKENKKALSYIHEVFSNCYICDTNGKVIIGNV